MQEAEAMVRGGLSDGESVLSSAAVTVEATLFLSLLDEHRKLRTDYRNLHEESVVSVGSRASSRMQSPVR